MSLHPEGLSWLLDDYLLIKLEPRHDSRSIHVIVNPRGCACLLHKRACIYTISRTHARRTPKACHTHSPPTVRRAASSRLHLPIGDSLVGSSASRMNSSICRSASSAHCLMSSTPSTATSPAMGVELMRTIVHCPRGRASNQVSVSLRTVGTAVPQPISSITSCCSASRDKASRTWALHFA